MSFCADRLSPEDVERMVNDAVVYEEADRRALKRVEARTSLEQYVHQCRRLLKDKELRCGAHTGSAPLLRVVHSCSRPSWPYSHRGRMLEEDVEAAVSALDDTDVWVDSSDDEAGVAEYEQRLADLKNISIGPIFERYEVSPDGRSGGGGGGAFDAQAHDEL